MNRANLEARTLAAARRIRRNSDDVCSDVIDWQTFSKRQRRIWIGIERNRAVLDGVSEILLSGLIDAREVS